MSLCEGWTRACLSQIPKFNGRFDHDEIVCLVGGDAEHRASEIAAHDLGSERWWALVSRQFDLAASGYSTAAYTARSTESAARPDFRNDDRGGCFALHFL
jgi:hypothetical protein